MIWINTTIDLPCEQTDYTARKENDMRIMTLLLAGAVLTVATAATSQAAPLPTHLAAMKAAIGSDAVQVR